MSSSIQNSSHGKQPLEARVIPVLTKALIELGETQPDDPITWLAKV